MGTRTVDQAYDTNWLLKDAGLVASSAAATVSSVAKQVDLGSATNLVTGNLIIYVSAVEITDNNELFEVILEGGTVSGFGSGTIQALARKHFGAAEVLTGAEATDSAVGTYVVPFRNEANGTYFRYLRIYTVVSGTVGTGINFTVRAAPNHPT